MTLAISATAQRQISYGYTEINKVQYYTCRKTAYLAANAEINKQSGRLIIPVLGKPSKVFNDNNSDENFHEFAYLGDINGTMLSLVKHTAYNREEFCLVNRSTGAVDTLIGEPVFAANMKDIACINNPGTDEKQRVQICELRNGSVKTRVFLRSMPNTLLEDIGCISRNFVLVKDSKGRYWKLNFRIGGE